jgi:hypothetical protein
MWRLMCVLGVLLALLGEASAQSRVRVFTAGQWKGYAYFKDGTFLRCAMWAPYMNGWDLFFAIDQAGYFSVLLRNAKLDLLTDMIFRNRIGARMQIDDTPVVIRPFTAISTDMLETKFATNLDWVARLPTGRVLRVNTGSRTARFPLTDLKEALPQLRACTAKHRAAARERVTSS